MINKSLKTNLLLVFTRSTHSGTFILPDLVMLHSVNRSRVVQKKYRVGFLSGAPLKFTIMEKVKKVSELVPKTRRRNQKNQHTTERINFFQIFCP